MNENYQTSAGNYCWNKQRYCQYADSLIGFCSYTANCIYGEYFFITWNRTLTEDELQKFKNYKEKE